VELIAIVWFLCGVTCGVIAESKNRSGIGWFFVGLGLGIFAILMVACMPALSRQNAS
jgi:hypothetical protein